MGVRALEENYNFYKLLKDIPGVDAGAIFYWDENDNVYGSIADGCLKLCWTEDGICYHSKDNCGLCGDTIIFHASVRNNREWFELVKEYIEPEEEVYEMTLAEIEEELGYKIKIKS